MNNLLLTTRARDVYVMRAWLIKRPAWSPRLYIAYPTSPGGAGECPTIVVVGFAVTGVLGCSSRSLGWNPLVDELGSALSADPLASVPVPAPTGGDGASGVLTLSLPSSVSVLDICSAPPTPRLMPLTENLGALLEIKFPIPLPQLAIEDLAGEAIASTAGDEVIEVVETAERVDTRLSGLNFDSVGGGEAGIEGGAAEADETTSEAAAAPELDPGSDSFRCAARRLIPPLTPSNARKKPVDPAARAFVSVSRAGASCWSIFKSVMPSCSRSPISPTTVGFSSHGCLPAKGPCQWWSWGCGKTAHFGSTMSKSRGSVMRFQTS